MPYNLVVVLINLIFKKNKKQIVRKNKHSKNYTRKQNRHTDSKYKTTLLPQQQEDPTLPSRRRKNQLLKQDKHQRGLQPNRTPEIKLRTPTKLSAQNRDASYPLEKTFSKSNFYSIH
jgi:hypothetical protein